MKDQPKSDILVTYFLQEKLKNRYIIQYLVRDTDIKPPNHESCFPQFFHKCFCLRRWKQTNKTFHWSKKNCFRPIKSLFSFHLLNLWKIRGKNWGKQDSCLVVWCQEQDIRFLQHRETVLLCNREGMVLWLRRKLWQFVNLIQVNFYHNRNFISSST